MIILVLAEEDGGIHTYMFDNLGQLDLDKLTEKDDGTKLEQIGGDTWKSS